MMFKESFKYYKSRVPPPDFDEVVDFKKVDSFSDKVRFLEPHQVEANEFPLLLRPVSEWKIFELIDRPGLLFVENPWTEVGVRYWVCRSLQQLTRPPSKLNIDHDDHRGACLNIEHNDHRAAWWDEAQLKRSQDGGALLRRLRWATFGYHHNWDTKEYSEQNKCAFPEDLAAVCRYVADAVGGWSEFEAQAAILNFYHPYSTLSGHRDHSEPNMEAPLLSFSFGQSAIFLVGGLTLDERPRAVFVDNGDVMIMSAAARLVYHGVPRIVTSRHQLVPSCSTSADNGATSAILNGELLNCILNDDNDRFWRPFCDYVSQSRINMNVRQVLCSGQTSL